jgi:hypothetical protein
MSIWNVNNAPEVRITSWRVFEVSGLKDEVDVTTRHFVGYEGAEQQGRVSSSIVRFDKSLKVGTTRSGKHYLLHGQSGYNQDALYTWEKWKYMNQITSECVKDVTNEYTKPGQL